MGIMAASGACLLKAGENVSTEFTGTNAETKWEALIAQAESYVNAVTRFNWSDVYSTLNSDVKLILEDVVSNLAAIYGIQFDMFGYTSTDEAEVMINVLMTRATMGLGLLKDQQ